MESVCYLWIGRLYHIKMSILFNLIYRINAIPAEMPACFFCKYQEAHFKTDAEES